MDVFLVSEAEVDQQARAKGRREEKVFKVKTSPRSRCRRAFFLKPDRSDRQTGGNPSQITSTGEHRVDHMTAQSRCVCIGGSALMSVSERAL